ncbi:hypothetical protein HID58_005077 [Brassica napus]|uniref:Uncharacterized protein n=1 Tax=Brassica napus TaxID=3708 RepID=A0ABQ8E7L5_BRANA|nr:hypothetical protein HID58_005077 [Brassica napus]
MARNQAGTQDHQCAKNIVLNGIRSRLLSGRNRSSLRRQVCRRWCRTTHRSTPGIDGVPGVVTGAEVSGASADGDWVAGAVAGVTIEAVGLVTGAAMGDFTGFVVGEETGLVAAEGEETGEVAGAKTGGCKGDAMVRDKTGGVAEGDAMVGEETGDFAGVAMVREDLGDVTGAKTGDLTGVAMDREETGEVGGEKTGDLGGAAIVSSENVRPEEVKWVFEINSGTSLENNSDVVSQGSAAEDSPEEVVSQRVWAIERVHCRLVHYQK